MFFRIPERFPRDWWRATEGRRTTAREFMMAEGNMTKGRAIPVRTP